MQNIWVVSGPVSGGVVPREYFTSASAAKARVQTLMRQAQQEFEALDDRVDLDVTWDLYQQIQNLSWDISMVPYVNSLNPDNDYVDASGPEPTGRLWLVLEDGLPEEGRGYEQSEDDARDVAWNRNWAIWESYTVSVAAATHSFPKYRREHAPGNYDHAPVDPGPVE